nr:unnamed protein product [Digitaria exilis]
METGILFPTNGEADNRKFLNLVKQNMSLFYFDAALLGLLGADLVQRIEQCPIAPSSMSASLSQAAPSSRAE